MKRSLLLISMMMLVCFAAVSKKSFAVDFFGLPQLTAAALSPDGKHIVMIKQSEAGQSLILTSPGKSVEKYLLNLKDFTSQESQIGGIAWLDNENISAQFITIKKGVEALLDTKMSTFMLVIQIPDKNNPQAVIKSVRTDGWLVDPLVDENDVFLYAKSGPYSKVYRIRPSLLSQHQKSLGKLDKRDGGQFKKDNEVMSVEGYALRWFFDPKAQAKAVMTVNRQRELILSRLDEQGHATQLKLWKEDDDSAESKGKRLQPIALAEDGESFYCLDRNEELERSVYRVNFSSGEETLLFESDSHQIVRLILEERTHHLVGVKVLKNGELQNQYIDKDLFKAQSIVSKTTTRSLDAVVSKSRDERWTIFYHEAFNQPGQFLLLDSKSKKQTLLGNRLPSIKSALTTRQLEGSVMVEGLSIPYILNLPEKGSRHQFPLVVNPHGGPIGVFDTHFFDPGTQYLNAQGFAVLRVNYRGSSGYSLAHKEAGKQQWGQLILQDILQATQKVQQHPEIDAQRTCLFGMSYGGYAATMLTIQHPEVYRCGVDVAGVSDVNLYLNSPYVSARQEKWMREYVGDTVGDYEAMKAISPVYQVEKLQRPLLIMHGDKDEVVDQEHAYRLKLMLEKYQKSFEWEIFKDEGHSLSSPEFSNRLFSRTATFMRQQLDVK